MRKVMSALALAGLCVSQQAMAQEIYLKCVSQIMDTKGDPLGHPVTKHIYIDEYNSLYKSYDTFNGVYGQNVCEEKNSSCSFEKNDIFTSSYSDQVMSVKITPQYFRERINRKTGKYMAAIELYSENDKKYKLHWSLEGYCDVSENMEIEGRKF